MKVFLRYEDRSSYGSFTSSCKCSLLEIQDKKQKEFGASMAAPSVETRALFGKRTNVSRADVSRFVNSKQQQPKSDCPVCSYCGLSNHTVEKCYKLHGFPLRYKFKEKLLTVNQVLGQLASTPLDTNCSMTFLMNTISANLKLAKLTAHK